MDKSHPPRSFGVFKPVGHTVVAFESAQAMEAAAHYLARDGFALSAMVRYTPQEMIAQVKADLLTASPLAAVGQELNLVQAHRELGEIGCSFLVVQETGVAQVDHVDAMVQSFKPVSAQRYGRYLIEDLTTARRAARQSFESPDRGLDRESPGTRLH
jgi:hypothetical protein